MPTPVVAVYKKAETPLLPCRSRLRRPGLVWIRERPTPYREVALALLWPRAGTLTDGLVTEDGTRFKVVYPGRPSGRAGPDFRDSVLAMEDGRLVTGDVELHVDAPGWRSHGHESDPNYNSVILHVVLSPKGRVSSPQQSRVQVPVASLGPVVARLEQADPSVNRDPVPWDGLSGDALERLLDVAGDRRFLTRSRGFARELDAGDANQALYAALFEALGYGTNRRPFRRLAEIVPYSTAASLRREPAGTRTAAIQALLLTASGLTSYAESLGEIASVGAMAEHLPPTQRLPAGAWRLFRVRPSNHPARRVVGAARLVDRFLDPGLASYLEAVVRRAEPSGLTEALSAPPYVGAGRARDMAVNVVLPFMHALSGVRRDPRGAARCLEAYRGFPGLADNEITREMKLRVGDQGSSPSVKGARRHQGLTYLYNVMTRPELARSEWPSLARALEEA